MKNEIIKIVNPQAQALVVLLIFMSIALVLLTSVSFSAIKTAEAVRKNADYQSAFDNAESLVDQMAVQIDKGNFSPIKIQDSSYLTGTADVKYIFNEYITIKKDLGVNIDVETQKNVGKVNAGGAVTALLTCNKANSEYAVEVTEIYADSAQSFYSDRQIVKCDLGGSILPNLTGATSMTTSEPSNPNILNGSINISSFKDLKLVRLKALGADANIKFSILSNSDVVAGTSKYVIVASGLSSDGSSSSTIQVEKPAGFYTPNNFDYVYFQGQ